jgi:hypothetical protein
MGRHRIEILIETETDDAYDAVRFADALYALVRLIDGSSRSVRVIDVDATPVVNEPT